jgi:hypothetical protein
MHTLFAALLSLADTLFGLFTGAFAMGALYVAIQAWLNGETWKARLAAAFFFCILAGASATLFADANQHLDEVVDALLS